MTLQILFYTLAVGATLGVVAWCCERIVGWFGMARRLVWVAAMALTIGFPMISVLTAAPAAWPDADPGARVVSNQPEAAHEAQVANVLHAVPTQGPTPLPSVQGAALQDPASPTTRAAAPGQSAEAHPVVAAWRIPQVPAVVLVRAWMLLSGSLCLGLMLVTCLLHRRAARWPTAVIGGQPVLVSDQIGPALIGAWQPRIVVPRWFLQEAPGLQSLVLAHERSHLLARDPLLLRLALLAVIVVPWNLPLWWQLRQLRRAIELDCDQRVLQAGVPASAYGHALLQVARRITTTPVGAVAMGQPASTLESRIRQLQPERVRHATLRAAALGLLAMAAGGLALTMEAPAFVTRAAMQTAAQGPITYQPSGASEPSGAMEGPTDRSRAEAATGSEGLTASPALAVPDAPTPVTTAESTGGVPAAESIAPPVAVQAPASIGDPGARALQEVLRAHPELLDSPHRDGWYSAAVLLRADGSLVRSGLRFAADRAQAIRDILDQRYIPESAIPGFGSAAWRPASQPLLELKRPGEQVGGGQVLRNYLVIQYGVLPAGYDESRAPLKVWEAVADRHAELLLPRDGAIANRVTLLLAEDGSIAREKVEVGTRAQLLASAPDFSALGVDPQDIGARGVMTLTRTDYSEVDLAPMDQQMLRAALWSALGVRDELQVHYAWMRRPGEVPANTTSPRPAVLVSGVRDIDAVQSLRSAAAEALQNAAQP